MQDDTFAKRPSMQQYASNLSGRTDIRLTTQIGSSETPSQAEGAAGTSARLGMRCVLGLLAHPHWLTASQSPTPLHQQIGCLSDARARRAATVPSPSPFPIAAISSTLWRITMRVTSILAFGQMGGTRLPATRSQPPPSKSPEHRVRPRPRRQSTVATSPPPPQPFEGTINPT